MREECGRDAAKGLALRTLGGRVRILRTTAEQAVARPSQGQAEAEQLAPVQKVTGLVGQLTPSLGQQAFPGSGPQALGLVLQQMFQ